MCKNGSITARSIRDQILLFVTTPTQRQHNLNSTSTKVGFDTKIILQNPTHPLHSPLGPDIVFLSPHGLFITLLYPYENIHQYSGLHSINTYRRIRSWWHLETSPRLQNSLMLVKIWCLASPASKSDLPRKSRSPRKFTNCAFYAIQPPVRSSIDSQSQFFRRLPSISRKCASLLQPPVSSDQNNRFPIPIFQKTPLIIYPVWLKSVAYTNPCD